MQELRKLFHGSIELRNFSGTNFNEDELKAIVSAVFDLFKEIQDLLPDRFPKKEISERETNLGNSWREYPVYSSRNRIVFYIKDTAFIYVRKDGVFYEDSYHRTSNLNAGELYLYLQKKEEILNLVKVCKLDWEQAVNEEMKIFSSTLSNKESANSYFEKVFHNTGKTLKSVVKDMQDKGYSKSDIVSAILNVLGDVNWED